MKPRDLMQYRGRPVRIYLYDGVAFEGVFASELLNGNVICFSLGFGRREVVLPIEDIVDVLPPTRVAMPATA